MINITRQQQLNELVVQWQAFFNAHEQWQDLIQGYAPIPTPCGIVYELPNMLNRPNEGLAIVDMRQLSFAEPHYHPHECVEIYFVLQGCAAVVVAGDVQHVTAGDVVIIPPNKAHFTIPDDEYVIGVINTPPYTPESYKVLESSDLQVQFDYDQFKMLVGSK
jgi:mannose-6-phosphate isomerase-like protein (cupin superfamily)